MSEENWYRIKGCLIASRLKVMKENVKKRCMTTQEKYDTLQEMDILINIISELSDEEKRDLHADIHEILDHYEE